MTFGIAEYLTSKVLDSAWDQTKKHIIQRRLVAARRILLEELDRGIANVTDIDDVEEAAAMVFEYADAAQRGTARRNLRMMAQVLAGLLVSPPVYANDFLRWSRIIADLTQIEIIVLSEFYKAHSMEDDAVPKSDTASASVIRYQFVRDSLISRGVAKEEQDVKAILQALGRNGLVVQSSGFGTIVYDPSSYLDDVMRLVRVDEVLAEPVR